MLYLAEIKKRMLSIRLHFLSPCCTGSSISFLALILDSKLDAEAAPTLVTLLLDPITALFFTPPPPDRISSLDLIRALAAFRATLLASCSIRVMSCWVSPTMLSCLRALCTLALVKSLARVNVSSSLSCCAWRRREIMRNHCQYITFKSKFKILVLNSWFLN